ncbi:MAG: hypothetical protein HQM14_05100 [SAR324 cluster bacterium]|nr:hypothetical protein [SAR324 cluster bacterium]
MMVSGQKKPFDQDAYFSRKKREKWRAWFFISLGGLVLLDSYSPFPVPIVGAPSFFLGSVLLYYGYQQFKNYSKLPMYEALQLGRSLKRELTRTDVFLTFQLTPEKTDLLLDELIKNGFIEPVGTELTPESDMRYRVIS